MLVAWLQTDQPWHGSWDGYARQQRPPPLHPPTQPLSLCCPFPCRQVERVLHSEHRRLRDTLWELLVRNAPSARK